MTIRDVLGVSAPVNEHEKSRRTPVAWLFISMMLAAAVERIVKANVNHHQGIIAPGAFVLAMALFSAPGWLVVLRLRRRD